MDPDPARARPATPSFALLGPLEARLGATPLPLGGHKQRSVLVALLLAANEAVGVERLIGEVWGDEPPAQARNALQTYISKLRKVLEPQRATTEPARILCSASGRYVLRVGDDATDVARFERLMSDGRALLRAGDPAEARRRLRAALALWRGPALAAFADQPGALAEAARLHELRALAVEDRIAADLAVGDHRLVIGELQHLVREEPLREQLVAQLMLALYRCGRQDDALAAYERCRTLLDEQLGIRPGSALRRLHEDLLRQSPGLDAPGSSELDPGLRVGGRTPIGRHAHPERGELVGRADELARLRSAWADARSGRGGLVLVSGDPGIGKTRLAEELALEAGDGARSAWGRCSDGDGAPALWPWIQVMRALMPGGPPPGIEQAIERGGLTASDLAPLTCAIAPASAHGTGTEQREARFRLCHGAAIALIELSVDMPLLVVIDDLHWSDVVSLQLVTMLAERVRDSHLLVLGTYREPEAAGTPALAAALAAAARLPATTRVSLTGLDAPAVGRLVASRSGEVAPASLVLALHERTAGNPFFIEELLGLLRRDSGLADAEVALRTRVPAGVRDVIRFRVSRLPEPASSLLSVAAVIGPEASIALLGRVSGLSRLATLHAVEIAIRAALLVQRPAAHGVRFSHALVRDAVYEVLGPTRRAQVHAAVAEELAAHEPHDDAAVLELAHHVLGAATLIDPAQALPSVLRAADVTAARLGYEQALELLRRALALVDAMPPGADRDAAELAVQVRIGFAGVTLGGPAAPRAARAFARAHELSAGVAPDADQLAAVFGLCIESWILCDFARAAKHAAQMMVVAHESHDPRFLCAAHFACGGLALYRAELAVACSHLERSIAIADSLADPLLATVMQLDPRIAARGFHAQALALMGHDRDARELVAEGLAVSRDCAHAYSVAGGLGVFVDVPVILRDVRWTRELAEAGIAAGRKGGFAIVVTLCRVARAWALAHDGEATAALAEATDAIAEHDAAGLRIARTIRFRHLAEINLLAGRHSEATRLCDAGLAEVAATGERVFESELHRLRGELLLTSALARPGEAESCMRRAIEIGSAQGALTFARDAEACLDGFPPAAR